MLEGNLHMANHPAENTAHLLCKKIGEGEKAAYNKLSTELAKELKPLLDKNKEVSSWAIFFFLVGVVTPSSARA
jgi:hypothetical protein